MDYLYDYFLPIFKISENLHNYTQILKLKKKFEMH
jgi:hypothetical protein